MCREQKAEYRKTNPIFCNALHFPNEDAERWNRLRETYFEVPIFFRCISFRKVPPQSMPVRVLAIRTPTTCLHFE